jgi:hypothetical protein
MRRKSNASQQHSERCDAPSNQTEECQGFHGLSRSTFMRWARPKWLATLGNH